MVALLNQTKYSIIPMVIKHLWCATVLIIKQYTKGVAQDSNSSIFCDFDFFEDSSECFHMLPPTKNHFSINYFVVFREMLKNLETVVWILVQDCSNSTVAKELPWRLWSYCSLALSILWAHKISAWNSHRKCDFWHCVFSRDYFGELAKQPPGSRSNDHDVAQLQV